METREQSKTLRVVLRQLSPGEAISQQNLTLVPLRGEGHGQLDYVLGAEAFQAGTLKVSEVGEGGTVPELLATNDGEKMVLLLEGEELVGAKQNRILNTSVLLPARTKTKIPVSCVEAGRWHHRSHGFSSGSYSSSSLRALLSHSVSVSYTRVAEPRSDQGGVWAEVDRTMKASGSQSPTRAWFDMIIQRQESLKKYADGLACPAEARGVLVAIDGTFVALDVFDKPATLALIWSRLVRGYAVDAMMSHRAPDERAAISPTVAQDVLERLNQTECRSWPLPGVGEDLRFEASDVLGHALMVEGTCVHLSAFASQA